jgi:hypothetical protein
MLRQPVLVMGKGNDVLRITWCQLSCFLYAALTRTPTTLNRRPGHTPYHHGMPKTYAVHGTQNHTQALCTPV